MELSVILLTVILVLLVVVLANAIRIVPEF